VPKELVEGQPDARGGGVKGLFSIAHMLANLVGTCSGPGYLAEGLQEVSRQLRDVLPLGHVQILG